MTKRQQKKTEAGAPTAETQYREFCDSGRFRLSGARYPFGRGGGAPFTRAGIGLRKPPSFDHAQTFRDTATGRLFLLVEPYGTQSADCAESEARAAGLLAKRAPAGFGCYGRPDTVAVIIAKPLQRDLPDDLIARALRALPMHRSALKQEQEQVK